MISNLENFLCLSLQEVDEAFTAFVLIICIAIGLHLAPVADRHCTFATALVSHPDVTLITIQHRIVVTIVPQIVNLRLAITSNNRCPDPCKYPTAVSSVSTGIIQGRGRDAAMRLQATFIPNLPDR